MGPSWDVMGCHGTSCDIMGLHGITWDVMGYHETDGLSEMLDLSVDAHTKHNTKRMGCLTRLKRLHWVQNTTHSLVGALAGALDHGRHSGTQGRGGYQVQGSPRETAYTIPEIFSPTHRIEHDTSL